MGKYTQRRSISQRASKEEAVGKVCELGGRRLGSVMIEYEHKQGEGRDIQTTHIHERQ